MNIASGRALTVVLLIALIGAFGGTIFIAINPPTDPASPYTEFYVLNESRSASDYPTNLTTGETATFVIGVVNHEDEEVTYVLRIVREETLIGSRTITLDDEEQWESTFSFTPRTSGQFELQLLLYQENNQNFANDPYRSLRLMMNVSS